MHWNSWTMTVHNTETSAVEGEHGGEANAELIVSDQGAAAVTDDGEDICTADCCCIARENPNQPISKEILLCTTRQKLFCFYCSTAVRSNLLVFSRNADKAFVGSGFCN